MKVLVIFFLIENPPHIYLRKFLIFIYFQKIFSTNQIAGLSVIKKLIIKYEIIKYEANFFLATRHSKNEPIGLVFLFGSGHACPTLS